MSHPGSINFDLRPSPFHFEIQAQPDDTTCGQTCLHAVYSYYGERVSLDGVIHEIRQLEEGGTLAVDLARHAIGRGYGATIYAYNMLIFDPTWHSLTRTELLEKMRLQLSYRDEIKRRLAIESYIDYLQRGGAVRFTELKRSLIRRLLADGTPILAGLSSTYLYQTPRERGMRKMEYDDIKGEPMGHFVVICGYDPMLRTALVADPLLPNPMSEHHFYEIDIDRLIRAILLGVLTYDANLLILRPAKPSGSRPCPR